jgi:isocitrate dehydrogenase (NAD+)
MLLDHVGQGGAGDRLRRGVYAALADDRTRTADLGGKADTRTFTDAVIAAMGA